MTKAALLAIATDLAPSTTRYKWQDWVDEQNKKAGWDIRVLLLPIAHPRLNPIELQWAALKFHVKNNNRTFSMPGIEQLAWDKLRDMQTDGSWPAAVANSHKHVKLYWRMDECLLEDAAEEDNDDLPSEDEA